MSRLLQYDITASIVAYRSSPGEILKAARSFLDNPFRKKIIIIDHSPGDELREVFAGLAEAAYFHHPENRGFGAGHNIAIRKIIDHTPYHLVLNPDVAFTPDVIPKLLQYMEIHAEAGQMMPKVLDQAGRLQYLAKLLPGPLDLLFKRFLPASLTEKRMDRLQLKFTGYNEIMNVPYLSGCFMLLKTKALKEIGLFDERFFMYPEDIDLTRRMHERYTTIYYPFVSIIHRHEASSYKSRKMLWTHLCNMVKYFNKWGWIVDKKRKDINRRILNELGYFHNKD